MSGFLGAPSPRWFSIPAHRPFLDDLAAGLMQASAAGGPEALADATVLLPNRRAVRGLAEAVLRASGGRAVMPPNLRALGDLDEDEAPFEPGDLALELPPAVTPERRRFELAAIVADNAHLIEGELTALAALELADQLAAFIDACQIEEVAQPIDLEVLVEGDMARHWRRSADFLRLALDDWPRRLADLGLIDVAARRVALLRSLTERWRTNPPKGVLVAAGSTGSTPATAALLAAVASAPKGCVVLPGLDLAAGDPGLADRAWAEVGDQHPQNAMKRLLAAAGVDRREVRDWPVGGADPDGAGRWRRRVISEALRPAERTADWLEVIGDIEAEAPGAIARGLDGLELVAAASEEEAAQTAALMLREVLETPGRTAQLVTPDQALARRVGALLGRWRVTPDSSVGLPLSASPTGVLAALVARRVADPADPVALLAIAKHPLTALGFDPDALAAARSLLEVEGLRGPAPASWTALKKALASPEARDLADRLEAALALAQAAFADGVTTARQAGADLIRSLEALARTPAGDTGALWGGGTGEAVGRIFASLLTEAGAAPRLTAAGFADLLQGLLDRGQSRPGEASHPRLRILGVLEARLMSSDLAILAGLEEGVWPAPAPTDPFLSRPMRRALGLPSPERRIGLAAHDFAQAACAPRVVLLTCARRAGAPAVESRWLWRLRTLIGGARVEAPGRPEMLAWARTIDAPLTEPPASLRTATSPRPTRRTAPPLAKLSVTQVETWIRDPYAIYAKKILRLEPLEPPGAAADARRRGTAVHKAFERLAALSLNELEAEGRVAEVIVAALREEGLAEARLARERALAVNLAPWAIAFERRRRVGARTHAELRGGLILEIGGRAFTLSAKADRIEARAGSADILDFKTGAPPSADQVKLGLSPQLTLTAAILAGGGFAEVGPATPGELVYVRVKHGAEPLDEQSREADWRSARAGLERRLVRFDDPRTQWLSKAVPQFVGDVGDYDDLARVWEWWVIGEAGE